MMRIKNFRMILTQLQQMIVLKCIIESSRFHRLQSHFIKGFSEYFTINLSKLGLDYSLKSCLREKTSLLRKREKKRKEKERKRERAKES